MFDFKHQLSILPSKPGVYLMKNSLGEIIYVGKAKILKNRVRQYFQNSKNHSEKVKKMVKNISEFEYIVTDSEMEALILECNLIKKYRPKYNILLKDDKFYPFIKITLNEDFPRAFITRNYAKDGCKYFGPYPNVSAVNETMDLIKDIFPIRTCKRLIIEGKKCGRPCLNYHINKCKAPCYTLISKEDYKKMILEVISILNGNDKNIVNDLKRKMEEASNDLRFEEAAKLRDKIMAIDTIVEKQKIFTPQHNDEDFVEIYKDSTHCCVQIFFLRDGKVMGRDHFIIENNSDEDDDNIISQFVISFYSGTPKVPKNLYIPKCKDSEILQQFLIIKKGKKVVVKSPIKGEKKHMMNLVKENAKVTLEKFKDKIIKEDKINTMCLYEIKELLNLDEVPLRIEAFDISNIQGVDSVGSMIVFEYGKPKKNDYRRFAIKTVKNVNDYDSMREMLERRFKRGLKEVKEIQQYKVELSSGKFSIFPDLIMMDGGKGQINIALDVLKNLNIDIPVCGLVKDDNHNTRGIIFDNKEYIINRSSNLMQLIRRIQDEVHRFAITYHRSLRHKRTLHSVLEEIPNIGRVRRVDLLKKFGSIEKIKSATEADLIDVPSIDKKAANSILAYFKNYEQKN